MERRLDDEPSERKGTRVACVLHRERVPHHAAGGGACPPPAGLGRHFFAHGHDATWLPRLGMIVGSVEPDGARVLARHEAVQALHVLPKGFQSPRFHPGLPKTHDVHRTWGLARVEAAELWRRRLEGDSVLIAHLDTGVDAHHPALASRIEHFFEVTPGLRARSAEPRWTTPHGTHTAGTLVGRAVDGIAIGAAPAARLVSALVDCTRDDSVEQVLVATEAVLDMRADGANIRVMSVSLATTWDPPNAFDRWASALRENGILPVAAIGNAGPGGGQAPGNGRHVLSVGALDRSGSVRSESGDGTYRSGSGAQSSYEKPDVLAPGGDVLSALAGADRGAHELAADGGTSMAAPHVAGIAALLFQAFPEATVDDVEAAILASCRPVADSTPQRQGHGVVGAAGAIDALEAAMKTKDVARDRPASRATGSTATGGTKRRPPHQDRA